MSNSYMEEIVWEKFRQKLLHSHCWPCIYVFKFIVPSEELEKIKCVFEDVPISLQRSKNGKYVSITSEYRVENCQEVVDIYREASKIPGVISL